MKRMTTMLIGMLAVSAVFGAEADPEYIQSFEFDVKMKTLESVRLKVTQETILKKYKLRLPILPPRLDADQVKALVEKEISARVEAAYPKSHFKQIEVDARYKFRKYNIGESVELRALDPRSNQFKTFKGKIRRIDKRGVLLGDSPHIFNDLDPKELTHFFQKKRDDAIMRYINGQTKVYEYHREQEDGKLRKKLLPKIWMDEGYVWNRRKRVWVPREDVFNYLYERKLIEVFKKEKPEHAEEVLSGIAGLKFDDALNVWIVPGQEPEIDPADAVQAAAKAAASKTDDSLKAWTNKFDDIFSEKSGDVWGEGDTGDAVPETPNEPKDTEKKEEENKSGDEGEKPPEKTE